MQYNEYDTVFKGGDLTQLMITQKGNRSKIPKHLSYPIYELLKSFLSNYNIHVGGAVMIGEYEVTAVTITPQFDIANEPILRELYSFDNAKVNIQFAYRESDDYSGNYAYAFWYDLTDFSCVLEKHVYGSVKKSKKYTSLKDMLKALTSLKPNTKEEKI